MKYIPIGDTLTELLYKTIYRMKLKKELRPWFTDYNYEGGIVDFYYFEDNYYAIWGSLSNEDAYIVFVGVEHGHDCSLEL